MSFRQKIKSNNGILRIDDLKFSYGNSSVLNGISLEVPLGVFYGIVGPNGCGKTTLLDLIVGVRRPKKGLISYKGKKVWRYPRRTLSREISYVPQEPGINFSFTVEEVVMMGRHPYMGIFSTPSQSDRDIVNNVLDALELGHLRNRLITRLSGGEKQRVIFARALAQQTPLILLDEATSNMDIYYTLLCLERIKRDVLERGITVIASFHDLNLAGTYCDRIAFLNKGKVIAEGETESVLVPENIMKTFGVRCEVIKDPIEGRNMVVFHSRP